MKRSELTSLKRGDGKKFVDQDYAKNILGSLFRLCKDIDAALARMQKGTNGVCVACGDEIGLEQQGESGKPIQADGLVGKQIEAEHEVRL